jgi:hypothetical protein
MNSPSKWERGASSSSGRTLQPSSGPYAAHPTNLIVTWDRSVLRCRVVSQVEEHLIYVAPAPAFRRIITFDNQMTLCMIMTGRMATWRLIATTNVTASTADSEMNPFAAGFQTFLAAARTWSDLLDGAQMRAAFTHDWYGNRGAPEAPALPLPGEQSH